MGSSAATSASDAPGAIPVKRRSPATPPTATDVALVPWEPSAGTYCVMSSPRKRRPRS